MPVNTKHREIVFVFALAIFCFLIYYSSIKAPFVFDDNHMITENIFITNPRHFIFFFKGFVTNYPIPKGMCRPLLMLTFAFNYANGGLNPVGYHIVNILLHFLNATLLYFLLRCFLTDTHQNTYLTPNELNKNSNTKNIPLGLLFMVTFLFIAHPLNTEAVTYISSRSDLMVTFFILCGFLLYLRNKYLLSCLMYILALLSKETALCLPILLLGHDFIFPIKPKETLKKWFKRKNVIFYASLVVLTCLYLFYRSSVFSATPTRILRSYFANTLLQSWVTFFYLRLFIIPASLNIIHHTPDLASAPNLQAFFPVSGIIALIVLIFILKKRKPLISLSIFWYLACLLPKFYARLNFPAMEHHFYLPSIGIYIILAILLKNAYLNREKYFAYAGTGIIIIFAVLSAFRNYEYKSLPLFWARSVRRNPHSGTIHNNLGIVYLARNLPTKAEKEFNKAIGIADRIKTVTVAKINLSYIYIDQGKLDQALELIKDCMKIYTPYPHSVYQTLGIIYMEKGEEKKAIEAWEKELELYPQIIDTYLNLGTFYFKKEDLIKAKSLFRKAIIVSPNHYGGYCSLGLVLERENKYNHAVKMYIKSILLKPDYAHSHYALGALYARLGNGKALYHLNRAIKLQPDLSQAHNDIAVAYASMTYPDWESAKKHALIAQSLGYNVEESLLQLINRNLKNDQP